MNSQVALDRCLTFINCQLQPNGRHKRAGFSSTQKPAVTISRQAGCDAHAIGEKVAQCLQAGAPKGSAPWTVIDRELVEKVLEEHGLPQRLAKFMPEDRVPEIEDILDDLLGVHPPSLVLVRETAETILRLATFGNVILIGRGANVITRKLEHVVHVRLIGSLAMRQQRVQASQHLTNKAALAFIRRADNGRRRYVKKYLHQDIDDPLLYHLVINTDLVPCETAAQLIAQAVQTIGSA